MKVQWRIFGLSAFLAGAGALLYGCLVESNKLVVRKKKLLLKNWPKEKNGFTLALMADHHIRDQYTIDLTQRACSYLASNPPDAVIIAGDFVGYWKTATTKMLLESFGALCHLTCPKVAVPGNHDYYSLGQQSLRSVCSSLGIQLLKNENLNLLGVNWVGIDSANANRAYPFTALTQVRNSDPIIVLWHEPDMVEYLPKGVDLMLSGHSHGGQFLLPPGPWAPMSVKNGRKYTHGFYPDLDVPLYVTSGIGTTGPPSRLLCPPEIVYLSLYKA